MALVKTPNRTIDLLEGDGLETMLKQFNRWLPRFETQLRTLPAEFFEEEEKFVIVLEIPGVPLEYIDVDVQGNLLTIRALKEEKKEKKELRYYAYERVYGEFERSFTLPRAVVAEQIKAELKDGILIVHLPKTKEARGRKIEIMPVK